jgi:hypothetical protein
VLGDEVEGKDGEASEGAPFKTGMFVEGSETLRNVHALGTIPTHFISTPPALSTQFYKSTIDPRRVYTMSRVAPSYFCKFW